MRRSVPVVRVERPLTIAAFPLYRLSSEHDGNGGSARASGASDRQAAAREDLPYKVELWDVDRKIVEQVLAVTANGSIGYAAFYAATREHPRRYITLRHKNSIVTRWNGPEH